MTFRLYQPSPALQPFIQGYLEADCSHEGGVHTLFPNGYSGIFFNFGNTGRLIIQKELKTPAISIFGQIDRHFIITHQPGFYSLGVLFNPTALSRLLHIDMAEFTNMAMDGQLIRKDFRELHTQLEETEGISGKLNLLNRFFRLHLLKDNCQPTLSEHAIQLLQQQKKISVERLAHDMGVSQRHLEIQFKRSVGLSPKTYSLIQRFKRVEFALRQSSSVSWQDMIFAHDYYDQNHFIKDFKRFTGHTPSDYLLSNLEMGRSYLIR